MSNPKGQPIPLVMKDSTWPAEEGWVKMQKNFKVYNRKTKKLEQIEIHYVWNESLELFDDFKFKNKPMELEDENSL